jgi:hypothetical protein
VKKVRWYKLAAKDGWLGPGFALPLYARAIPVEIIAALPLPNWRKLAGPSLPLFPRRSLWPSTRHTEDERPPANLRTARHPLYTFHDSNSSLQPQSSRCNISDLGTVVSETDCSRAQQQAASSQTTRTGVSGSEAASRMQATYRSASFPQQPQPQRLGPPSEFRLHWFDSIVSIVLSVLSVCCELSRGYVRRNLTSKSTPRYGEVIRTLNPIDAFHSSHAVPLPCSGYPLPRTFLLSNQAWLRLRVSPIRGGLGLASETSFSKLRGSILLQEERRYAS